MLHFSFSHTTKHQLTYLYYFPDARAQQSSVLQVMQAFPSCLGDF